MQTLQVALGERSYPIHVGDGLLGSIGQWLPATKSARAIIVTNPTVASHHLTALHGGLTRAGISHDTVLVPDGEAHKDWRALNTIHSRLIELGAERSTMLMALGGGVVGDLAGFAAATYQRGMPLVQLPTTLLAQVDSSVGGKTAINHPLGKNMIGAFYQPCAVVIDTSTLSTLPQRQYVAGLAEVLKYGAACDVSMFSWLESSLELLLARDAQTVARSIAQSCRIKAAIVAGDERETGARAILNFGHTFGHAIEAATDYDGSWLHGEAVAAGMVMAGELSVRVTGLQSGENLRLRELIKRAGLPIQGPRLETERYLTLMARDKKVQEGAIRFVLLEALGKACLRSDVSTEDIVAVLAG